MINFELRSLKSSDMFVMFKILSKIGFNDLKDKLTVERVKELTATFNKDDSKEVQDEQMTFVGFTVMLAVVEIIMKNLPSCEKEIYNLLSNLSGMTMKQIEDLPMVDFTQMVVSVLKKEEFKDFFKVVAGLFNQGN